MRRSERSPSGGTDGAGTGTSSRGQSTPGVGAIVTVTVLVLTVTAVASGAGILVGHTSHAGQAGAANPPPTTVPTPLTVVSTTPAPGSDDLGVTTETISVVFSTALSGDSPDPTLSPNVPGDWVMTEPTTLVFAPTVAFTPLTTVQLVVPAGPSGPSAASGEELGSTYTATFSVPAPSQLRLDQLLAQLDYLPLSFEPAAQAAPPATTGQPAGASALHSAAAASAPIPLEAQPGTFAWRYPNVPASLGALWQPGVETALVLGAVMAFESDHGLDDDGSLDATFWSDLLSAVASDSLNPAPYDYLEVSTTVPETLSVWRDGTIIYKTLANTGIPEAPTAPGTYPVYARYLSTTMSGFNPDGSYYDDPGVPYVAYFNGGDAVHGFLRASYGWPQSLGCVELPYSSAAVVFNEDPIGTLVTVS